MLKKKKGMTLMELLSVIAIIAILFVLLIPAVSSAIEKSKVSGVQTDLHSYQVATKSYLMENGDKEKTESDFNKYLDKSLQFDNKKSKEKNPWGNPYELEINNDSEEVISITTKSKKKKEAENTYNLTARINEEGEIAIEIEGKGIQKESVVAGGGSSSNEETADNNTSSGSTGNSGSFLDESKVPEIKNSDGWKYIENEDGTATIVGYDGTDTKVDVPTEIGGKNVSKVEDDALKDVSVIKKSGDWKYVENEDGTVTIVGYTGTNKKVKLPTTLAGKTVSMVEEDVLSGLSIIKTSGDWEYIVNSDGKVTIVGYNGTSTKLKLPTTLDGKTVDGMEEGSLNGISIIKESGDWEYIVNEDGSATIVGYTGSLSQVKLPSTLDGKTVKGIEGDTLVGVDIIKTSGKFDYIVNEDGTVTIIGYTGSDSSVIIPSTIDGKTVTGLASNVLKGKGVTTVDLPSSIVSGTGSSNFDSNATVKKDGELIAYQGETVTSSNKEQIEGMLKTDCENRSLTETDASYFTTVDVDGGVKITVYSSSGPKDVVIPCKIGGKDVVDIGAVGPTGAFESKSLTSVALPNTLKTISDYAFYYNKLTSVTIPNSVTSIEYAAFANNKFTSVTIPDSVTSIGKYTFENNQLTSVTIGYGVTSIGNQAFYSNSNLKTVINKSSISNTVLAQYFNSSPTITN